MEKLNKLVISANELSGSTLKMQGNEDIYEYAKNSFDYDIPPESELAIKNAIILAYNRGMKSE